MNFQIFNLWNNYFNEKDIENFPRYCIIAHWNHWRANPYFPGVDVRNPRTDYFSQLFPEN